MMTADRTLKKAPMARIKKDTPYFAGKVDALCLREPLFDLIIGNIRGARNPNDPDLNWGIASATITRAQAQQEETLKTLKVKEVAHRYSMTKGKLCGMQNEEDQDEKEESKTKEEKRKEIDCKDSSPDDDDVGEEEEEKRKEEVEDSEEKESEEKNEEEEEGKCENKKETDHSSPPPGEESDGEGDTQGYQRKKCNLKMRKTKRTERRKKQK